MEHAVIVEGLLTEKSEWQAGDTRYIFEHVKTVAEKVTFRNS